MNIREYNRAAWNREVERGNKWTVPVSTPAITAARKGQWEIFLTPTKPVPRAWFPDLTGLDVLCLASGGGQQGRVVAEVSHGSNLVCWLTVASFIPLALGVIWPAVTGHNCRAVAGLLVLLASGGLLLAPLLLLSRDPPAVVRQAPDLSRPPWIATLLLTPTASLRCGPGR